MNGYKSVTFYEVDCDNCGKSVEDAGALVSLRKGGLVLVCKSCRDADEDEYGLTYFEWE